MPVDTPVVDLVRQLRRIGLRPPERLVERIIAHGAEARDPLLAMATDRELLHEEPPGCYGSIHALRLLGELRDPTTIGPLLQQFPLELNYEDEPVPLVWSQDVRQLVGRIGAPAVEVLWAWFDNMGHHEATRAAACDALAYASVADQSLREGLISGFRQRLAETDDRFMAALIVFALARMAAAEAYGQVLEAYRAGRVDTSFLPLSEARQLILGKGAPNLSCVNHTLAERYEQHGPFPPQDK